MLMMHGAVYLQLRTDGAVQKRAQKAALFTGIVCALAFALGGIWIAYGIDGYVITSTQDVNSALNPLAKTVQKSAGAWLTNYQTYSWMMLAFSMFPFIMPSSTDPVSSLTIWDAVSSKKTLGIMLVVTVIFLPLILIYTSWVYKVLRGKVTVQSIKDNTHTAY
jgi:cytochrome d ubiquinol oxidase subunit II